MPPEPAHEPPSMVYTVAEMSLRGRHPIRRLPPQNALESQPDRYEVLLVGW